MNWNRLVTLHYLVTNVAMATLFCVCWASKYICEFFTFQTPAWIGRVGKKPVNNMSIDRVGGLNHLLLVNSGQYWSIMK